MVALHPYMYRYHSARSVLSLLPSGSSNATEREEMEPDLYEVGSHTQLGCCITVREAYVGLLDLSKLWFAMGMKGPCLSDALVGTPLIVIFNHLMFGLAVEMGLSEGVLKRELRMLVICGAAIWRECGMALGLLVTTRLPLVVHLMATSKTCGGEIVPSPQLSMLQRKPGLGQSSSTSARCTRSTTRLGLWGLTPAVAE